MTLSALGIFSAAGAGGGATGTYELVSSQILGSAQSAITFDVSSLASTYKHLQLRMTSKTVTGGGGTTLMQIRFNGDSGTNYSYARLWGSGGGITSAAAGSLNNGFAGYNFQSSNAGPAANICDILDPFSTTKNTTGRFLGGGADSSNFIGLYSFAWFNTNAVTSIVLNDQDGANFATGSRFSLYGIRG
jgi:hypothetical protein